MAMSDRSPTSVIIETGRVLRMKKFAAFRLAESLEESLPAFTAVDYAELVAMRASLAGFDQALAECQRALGEYHQARGLQHDGSARGEG
jgi:hypothetical protein